MTQQEFGNLMKDFRVEHNISKEAVANSAEISLAYYNMLEQGKYSPTWSVWVKLCDVLGIDIVEIQNMIMSE